MREKEKDKLKELKHDNFHYYTLCMCTYYCFIRRTELTKLKVSDVNLKDGFITISGENSKNKKTDNVTIPNALYPLLQKHLESANQNCFLFSKNNFEVGKTQLSPKKYLMNGQSLGRYIILKRSINGTH